MEDKQIPKKILVIDDDEGIRKTLKINLGKLGFDVELAATFSDGLILATLHKFDLALCDLKLPDNSGCEIIKTIKEKNINLPVVAISGFIDCKTVEDALAAGAVEYLAKPFKKEKLLAILESIL